jgi:hypothetical protein
VSTPLRPDRATNRLLWDAAAIATYTIVSAIMLHPMLAGGLSRFCIGAPESNDPQVFIWGIAWYPYAISHRLDPLFTNLVFAPGGYNLAWSTTIPAPALLMWPITVRFGPLVSFNLLSLMTPILSAYTAFALCRHVTKAVLPALVGGFVYGFSTYQRIEADHLCLALTFVPPLLTLLFALRLENRVGRLRYEFLLFVCLTTQFLISAEIFTTAILFGAIAIAAGWWIGDLNFRHRLHAPLRESVVAIALAVGALSPYIYRFIPSPFGLSPIYNPAHCSTDLLGLIFPTGASLVGGLSSVRALSRRISFGCEPAAYMGLLPVITIWLALASRGKPAGEFRLERFLALLLAVIVVLALGPVIHFGGVPIAPSVWLPALLIPIFNNALPARFVLYGFLVLSIAIAVWLADARRRASLRWLIAAAAVLSVLPTTIPTAKATLPFFSQRTFRDYLTPGETVMTLPFASNGEAMKWQAQSDFLFRVAGGYLGVIPHEYAAWPIIPALLEENPYIPGYADQFKAFLGAHHVGAIIAAETEYADYAKLCATLGGVPLHVGGVVFLRLNPSALAPFASMTAATMDTRYNLERFVMLVHAARDFLARGNSPLDLSPFAAVRFGLLDTNAVGDPMRVQASGYPFVSAGRTSRTFQKLAGYLVSHGMIRERLAIELGPKPPGDATSTSGIWLGPWTADSIAIGVVAGPQSAATLSARFGRNADAIYYPYPLPYSTHPSSANQAADPQMLLMTFKTASLPALDVSTPPRF